MACRTDSKGSCELSHYSSMKFTAQGGEPCIKVGDRRMKGELTRLADLDRQIFYIRQSVCTSEPSPRGKSVGERLGAGEVGRSWKASRSGQVGRTKKNGRSGKRSDGKKTEPDNPAGLAP